MALIPGTHPHPVLLPDINFLGMDGFWIGSILVIVLTGVDTIRGAELWAPQESTV